MESSEFQSIESKLSGETAPFEDNQTDVDHKRGGWTTFPFIIGTVMGLTLAAGGWSANLIVFLISEFNVKSINAAQINNIIQGCNSLFPVAGAIIADSFLGSFSVVTIFSFVSLLGVTMFTLAATIRSLIPPHCNTNGSLMCKSPSKLQYMVLYSALALSSIGLGGTRFTLATMGADQFDKAGDRGVFFNWYIITLYSVSAFCFIAIVHIQDNVSWGLGFGISVAANAIGLLVFLLGKRFYHCGKPKGSPFTTMARVVVAAIRKRKKKVSASLEGEEFYHGSNGMTKKPYNVPTKSFRFLNRAALKTEDHTRSDSLDARRSWKLCTVEEVKDLKTLIKIIPLWSTGIFLSTPIGIFNSLTILQALTMDRHLGPHFKIPAGSFLVFNILATAISLFLVDRLVLPMWHKVTGRALTPLRLIGIGHVLNISGMVSAALVEVKRLHLIKIHHLMDQSSSIVPMSALWLMVPLIIVGIGEAFHFPGQIAFNYQEFPTTLRSTSTAMISLLLGIRFYLSTAMVDLVRQTTTWLPDNINDGRLDNVFWMLALIGVVNLMYYLICAKLFKYQNVEKLEQPSDSLPS